MDPAKSQLAVGGLIAVASLLFLIRNRSSWYPRNAELAFSYFMTSYAPHPLMQIHIIGVRAEACPQGFSFYSANMSAATAVTIDLKPLRKVFDAGIVGHLLELVFVTTHFSKETSGSFDHCRLPSACISKADRHTGNLDLAGKEVPVF